MAYRRVATASALVPFAFALLGVAAWTTGHLRLASVRTEFIPMAPGTAVAFLIVSGALIALASRHATAIRNAVRVAASLVFVLAFIMLVEFYAGLTVLGWEEAIIGRAGRFGAVPLARMSPLTATTLALVGLALGSVTSARSPVRDLAGVLGSLILLIGSTVVLGYAYGAPLLYGGLVVPMALTTGLGLMGTGVALVALAGPTSLPLRPFSAGAIRAARAETERTRAEEALRDSEILARSLVEHLPQRIFVKDRNSKYVFCNSNYARDLGIEQQQIVGKDDFTLFPPELAEAYRADDRTVMTEGTIKVVDERYEEAGQERWIHTTKVPYRDEHGEITGVLGIFEDITDRKRSVEALRTAEERTRFALQSADVGIWDMDYTTGVLQWSEVLESQYGLQPGTFGGTFEAFLERIHPDDRASVTETVGNAMKSGADFSVHNRSIWPDGSVRWLSGAGRIFLDEHGDPIRGVGISQDVTERKRAEAELKHLNDEIQFQRLRVFKATMRTVQDIVNNLLNGLQLVHLEAEGRQSAEMQALVDRVIQEAAVKLKTLGDLETVKEREMSIGLGIDYPGSTS
jgi:PAS domain S-box-containing protein